MYCNSNNLSNERKTCKNIFLIGKYSNGGGGGILKTSHYATIKLYSAETHSYITIVQ